MITVKQILWAVGLPISVIGLSVVVASYPPVLGWILVTTFVTSLGAIGWLMGENYD